MTTEPAIGSSKSPKADSAGLKETILRLLEYCRANDWAGYDPYDALNSRVVRALPFLDFKWARLAITQGVKRCPINLRPLLLVPKEPNPKGTALFLSALVKLAAADLIEEDGLIPEMASRLMASRSPSKRYSCWGYNFDWQTRTYLVPRGSPNIICTTFAANALLDAYERSREAAWLAAAVRAAEFILDTLFWRESGPVACFSYTPVERTRIHNANLLGAALLARVARVAGERRFLEFALDAARYSVSRQLPDGSWFYGEASRQRWIDNFHTGYNLVALKHIRDNAGTGEFGASVQRGLDFYTSHFFRDDGAPRYYGDSTFPIDIHSVAQSIITLIELADLSEGNADLARSVFGWAMKHLWDGRGYFYYQRRPHLLVRTPFMRWSQAWMLLALSILILHRYAPIRK